MRTHVSRIARARAGPGIYRIGYAMTRATSEALLLQSARTSYSRVCVWSACGKWHQTSRNYLHCDGAGVLRECANARMCYMARICARFGCCTFALERRHPCWLAEGAGFDNNSPVESVVRIKTA